MTNLSDALPWGLWVGFDILCGVGLAAGGFTITTVVYVFNVKRFKPIVRPTILTAFLGYVLVVVALLFDLGRPWNIWHPLVMWNPRSVMFEVSWCVMLYLTVLALEFSGMVFERLGWTRALVVAARRHRAPRDRGGRALDPAPVLARLLLPDHARQAARALVHAAAAGDVLPLRDRGRPGHDHRRVAALLARASAAAWRCRSSWRSAGPWSRPSASTAPPASSTSRTAASSARRSTGAGRRCFFQLEFAIGVILPHVAPGPSRQCAATPGGSTAPALLVVVGFVVNRLNVSITGLEGAQGGRYVPAVRRVRDHPHAGGARLRALRPGGDATCRSIRGEERELAAPRPPALPGPED